MSRCVFSVHVCRLLAAHYTREAYLIEGHLDVLKTKVVEHNHGHKDCRHGRNFGSNIPIHRDWR
jgi:hypothetical protein